jgi:hypothetical protein
MSGWRTARKAAAGAGTDNSDPAVAETFLDAETGPREWYGDSAYGT